MLWQCITLIAIIAISVLFGMTTQSSTKYSGPPFERKLSETIDAFATTYAKQHQLDLINIGFFPELRDKRGEEHDRTFFGFWLAGYSTIDLKECRIQTTQLLKDFWQLVRDEPLAKECLKDYLKYDKVNRDQPLGIEHIGVKIAYWTKEHNRPLLPHIAQIHFFHGKFHYYQADPHTQALCLIFEESYEDAITHLETERNNIEGKK